MVLFVVSASDCTRIAVNPESLATCQSVLACVSVPLATENALAEMDEYGLIPVALLAGDVIDGATNEADAEVVNVSVADQFDTPSAVPRWRTRA